MFISHESIALQNIYKKKAYVKNHTPNMGSDIFQNIITEIMNNKQHVSDGISGQSVITEEQLIRFSKALQIQMSLRLYNVLLADHPNESNILSESIMKDYENNLYRLSLAVSKNGHVVSNKTINQDDLFIDQTINQAAQKYDVDAYLIRAVIKAESDMNPQAKSSKGAMGLMQLMPETARDLGVKNAYDVEENIMGGTRYLKMLLTRYQGQVDLALAAYNWGMGNLESKPDQLPEETISYITKVNRFYKNMRV